MEFNIWIGNRLPPMRDLNHLNLLPYLTQGSLIIERSDIPSPSINEVGASKRFMRSGGTLLKFNNVSGLRLGQFKVCGDQNEDMLNGDYLAADVEFVVGRVARGRYTTPKDANALSSRVLTATGAYMITYGVTPTTETRGNAQYIMDWLNANLPEGFTEPDFNIGDMLVPEKGNVNTAPTVTEVAPQFNAPPRRTVVVKPREESSVAALTGAAVGVAAELAVSAVVGSITG